MFISTSLFNAISFLHLWSKLPTISTSFKWNHFLTYVCIEYHLGLICWVFDECVHYLCAQQLILVWFFWDEALPGYKHRAQVSHEVMQALASIVFLQNIVRYWLEPLGCIRLKQARTIQIKEINYYLLIRILRMKILTLMWVSALLISLFSACINSGMSFPFSQFSFANNSTILSMHLLIFFIHSCWLTLSSSISVCSASSCFPSSSCSYSNSTMFFSPISFWSFLSSRWPVSSSWLSKTIAELNRSLADMKDALTYSLMRLFAFIWAMSAWSFSRNSIDLS